jgi:DnaJ family protein C protein 19
MNSRVALKAARLTRSQHNSQKQIIPHWSWRNNGNNRSSLASCDFHSFALRRNDDDDDKQRSVQTTSSRGFHTTAPSERAAALMMGLGAVSAVAYAGSSAVKSYNEWKAAQPSPEEVEEQQKKDEAEAEADGATAQAKQQEEEKKESSGPRENIFKEWFGVGVGSKYYEGGFDEKMTRKEAALILGVRESSSPKRVKDAHRKLLILNHPDTGGSTYVSLKLNEAKELLLKGRMRA